MYHGYENGYWTLGRQVLLDPVRWTADGWFRMTGGDLSKPLPKPKGGEGGPHGQPLSYDFTRPLALGAHWNFFRPGPEEHARVRVDAGTLHLAGRGTAPVDSAPLLLTAGDQAYEFQCDVEIAPGGTAGLSCSTTTSSIAGSASTKSASSPINMATNAGAPPIRTDAAC